MLGFEWKKLHGKYALEYRRFGFQLSYEALYATPIAHVALMSSVIESQLRTIIGCGRYRIIIRLGSPNPDYFRPKYAINFPVPFFRPGARFSKVPVTYRAG